MAIIKVKNLSKYFGTLKAVDNISFSVEKGEVFGFLGPNGAGKTTTIRCLMDFLRPTSGEIKIFDKNSQTESVEIKKNLSYVTSGMKLYDNWTGNNHINFFSSFRNDGKKIQELINKFNFNSNIKVKNLSFGNKQKLALLIAFIGEPKIIIMDEPTVGLDPLLQNAIYELIREYQQKGVTIFMSSHNLREVESLCSRVAIIKNGQLIAVENINDLKRKRLYKITVEFESGNVDLLAIPPEKAKIISKTKTGIIFQTNADINPFIAKISKHKVKHLEIDHADLEEIFLQFYK